MDLQRLKQVLLALLWLLVEGHQRRLVRQRLQRQRLAGLRLRMHRRLRAWLLVLRLRLVVDLRPMLPRRLATLLSRQGHRTTRRL